LQKNAANRGNVPLGHAVISQAQAEVAKAALTLWLVGVLAARKCVHSLVELLYNSAILSGISLRNRSEWSVRNSAPMPVNFSKAVK
jgi:hypothetical protein